MQVEASRESSYRRGRLSPCVCVRGTLNGSLQISDVAGGPCDEAGDHGGRVHVLIDPEHHASFFSVAQRDFCFGWGTTPLPSLWSPFPPSILPLPFYVSFPLPSLGLY